MNENRPSRFGITRWAVVLLALNIFGGPVWAIDASISAQPENVALSGAASQSSTGFGGSASRAIDGNRDGRYSAGSVSHTLKEEGAWWQVQLAEEYSQLNKIIVYNRSDCCKNRLDNFSVSVLRSDGDSSFVQDFDTKPDDGRLEIILPDGVGGDRVRVNLNDKNYLSLAEVEVWVGEEDTAPIEDTDGILQSGSLRITEDWQPLPVSENLTDPLVILGAPAASNDAPGAVRVKGSIIEGFSARFQPWSYLGEQDVLEDIDWIALSPGRYRFSDDTEIEAGRFYVEGNGWLPWVFSRPFADKPAVFVTLQTENDARPVTVRLKNVTTSGFRARLQHEESLARSPHEGEMLGYVAIGAAADGRVGEYDYELNSTKLTHKKKDILGETFWVQEEQSADQEVSHTRETVAVLKFDGGYYAQDQLGKGGDTSNVRRVGPDYTIVLDGLVVTGLGRYHIDIAWNAAAGPGAGLVSSYAVLLDGARTAVTNATSLGIDQLDADTAYTLQVQALDENGNILATGDSIEARTDPEENQTPDPPLNLTVVDATWSSVTLGWDASPGAPSYFVYRDGSLVASSSATGFTDSGLQPESTYHYRVTAVSAGRESEGADIQATTQAAPDTEPPTSPAGLRATSVTANSVSLEWSASQDNRDVAEYRVIRDGREIGAVGATTYVDNTVEEANRYSYSVVAVDSAGNQSAPGSSISVATPDVTAPDAVTGLSSNIVDTDIHLSWTTGSDNVAVIGYRLLRDGVVVATTASTGYVDNDLDIGREYRYSVAAFDAAGNESTPGPEVVATIEPPAVSGRALAETCAGCHGTDGLGVGPAIPNLAGMDKDYFMGVMQAYRNGERHGTMMGRIAKAYTDEELGLMADHYAALPFAPAEQRVNITLAARGESLHSDNCVVCHGSEGTNLDNGILAGQWKSYIAYTIADYLAGRSTDAPAAMITAIQGLSEADHAALAEYYAGYGGDTQAPPAPTNLAVADRTEYSVTLTWLDADDNWTIDHYDILRNGVIVGDSTFSVFTDSGLSAGEIYNYQVVAVDPAGNRSPGSNLIAVRTLGEPIVVDPSIQQGAQLWSANGCSSCHGAPDVFGAAVENKYNGEKTFAEALSYAIENNIGGMGVFASLSGQDMADIGAYVEDQVDTGGGGNDGGPPSSIDGVTLSNNAQTLRKAGVLLAGRLPTEAEYAQAETEEGLASALRNLMTGDRFAEFVYNTGERTFLNRRVSISELSLDFPTLAEASGSHRFRVTGDLGREPIELARHIVENDRSWREILTADYTMVNNRTAAAYEQVEMLESFETESTDEYRPARILRTSPRTPALAAKPYPHAGVLTTKAWLNRFPTTDSNRNRHRASMLYRQFLGVDIEALGQRPINDGVNGDYLVPTMENPACQLCHINMEPMAGAFQNWGDDNIYWQNGEDALSDEYKHPDYYLDHAGAPWHNDGDKWFRDMFEPGFEGKSMPGGRFGFNTPNPGRALLSRRDWRIHEVNTVEPSWPAANAIDNDINSYWHSKKRRGPEFPYTFSVDMGSAQTLNGLRYRPRRFGTAFQIDDYEVLVSMDGQDWRQAAAGALGEGGRDPRDILFNPVEARYFQLRILSEVRGSSNVTIAELYAYEDVGNEIPHAENANGGNDALQWLAREVADDPRFAMGAVRFWFPGVFGVKPLDAPVNPDAPGYAEALAAYETQNAVLKDVADQFKDSGYKVKDLLVALVTSDLFRAQAFDGAETDVAALEGAPSGRLLGPAEVDARGAATIGEKIFNGAYSSYGLLYGGFDGGKETADANSAMTPIMLSAAENRTQEALCNRSVVRKDIRLPISDRQLFPIAGDNDLPIVTEADGEAMIERIKRNIRHLHQHLLGEDLAMDDPEIERAYALFKEVFENPAAADEGETILCESRNGSTPVRRAWSAVLAYLMVDSRYLLDQ